jgi:DTW domain-containing protein YfiP
MKATIMMLAMFVSVGTVSAFADEATQKKVDEVTTPAKARKKKVEMCKECGKPETQCECEGYKHEEKKKD